MKKRYIQPEAEFDEIEDELLYKASWESETTTKENTTKGPATGEDISDDDDDDEWDW